MLFSVIQSTGGGAVLILRLTAIYYVHNMDIDKHSHVLQEQDVLAVSGAYRMLLIWGMQRPRPLEYILFLYCCQT